MAFFHFKNIFRENDAAPYDQPLELLSIYLNELLKILFFFRPV